MDIGNLNKKVALVTGGSSGLGRAISQAYANAGAFVVCADLTPNPPKTPILAQTFKGTDLVTPTVDLINSNHPAADGLPKAIFIECNVTQPTSVEGAISAAVKQFGRLDIMVNNAGITCAPESATSGTALRAHETPDSTWDLGMAINGKGVWLGSKYAAAQMLKQEPHSSGDRGWIINMCSVAGLVGIANTSIYSATKGAVLQMTKVMALEYAKDKIHVNCINPGWADTPLLEPLMSAVGSENGHKMVESLHPWGRMGQPDDIAKAAVFLAGPGASFVTGHALVVDGGYVAQ